MVRMEARELSELWGKSLALVFIATTDADYRLDFIWVFFYFTRFARQLGEFTLSASGTVFCFTASSFGHSFPRIKTSFAHDQSAFYGTSHLRLLLWVGLFCPLRPPRELSQSWPVLVWILVPGTGTVLFSPIVKISAHNVSFRSRKPCWPPQHIHRGCA